MNTLFLASIFAVFHSVAFALPLPIETKLEGPESVYTTRMISLAKNWRETSEDYKKRNTGPFEFKCVTTPGSATYVGVERRMLIKAPIARVKLLLESYSEYAKLLYGFADVGILRREDNKVVAKFEQIVPILPNVHYEMSYLETTGLSGRLLYRYQLREGRTLRFNDGLVVIEPTKDGQTYFTAVGFFDANWGLLTFSKDRIWRTSTEGVIISDLSILTKAENPTWTFEKAREQAKAMAATVPLEKIVEQRSPVTGY